LNDSEASVDVDDLFQELEDSDAQPQRPRPARQRKAISYAGLDHESDEEEEERDADGAEVVPLKEKKQSKKQPAIASTADNQSSSTMLPASKLPGPNEPMDLAARLAKRMASVHSSQDSFAKVEPTPASSVHSSVSREFKVPKSTNHKAIVVSDSEAEKFSGESDDDYEPSPNQPKKRKPAKAASTEAKARAPSAKSAGKRQKKTTESKARQKAKAKESKGDDSQAIPPKKMKALFSKAPSASFSSSAKATVSDDDYSEEMDLAPAATSTMSRPKRAVKAVTYCEDSDGADDGAGDDTDMDFDEDFSDD